MSITITIFVVLIDEVVLILLVVLDDEFLLTEEIAVETLLVGLLHRPLQLVVRQSLVAVNGDGVHLDLLLLIHIDVEDNLTRVVDIVTLKQVDVGILETLLVVVAADDDFGLVNHVGIDLISLHQADFALKVFALGFLDAVVVDLSQTGTRSKLDIQIDLIADELLGRDFDVGEQAVLPKALGGLCDFLSWNTYDLSDRESG